MSIRLHQLLGFEKDRRKRNGEIITAVHRDTQQEKLLQGVSKRYQALSDGGQQLPPEKSPVALRYEEAVRSFVRAWKSDADIVAQKDDANLRARADVVVEGRVLLSQVPATHLLFLEKHLEHVRTFIAKIGELPVGAEWSWDGELGLWKTQERLSHRTEKQQQPLVLYPATAEHPAQTQLITTDTIVGNWFTTFYHGGMPPTRKRDLLHRVGVLLDAVKEAREEANAVMVDESVESGSIIDFIFEAS